MKYPHKLILIILFALLSLTACSDEFEAYITGKNKIQNYQETRSISDTFSDLINAISKKTKKSMCLNPPATKQQIAKVEEVTGQTLPLDVKALYLIADGQNQSPDCLPLLLGYDFLPLDDVAREWKSMYEISHGDPEFETLIEVQGAVNAYGWSTKWIPIGSAGNGDLLVLDFVPSTNGRAGQLVEFIHDDSIRPHLGFDINSYLGRVEKDIKSGKLTYHEEWGIFTYHSS